MGKLTDKINSINELGRVNLAEKGVVLNESATTYEIMEGISYISQKEEIDYIEVIPEMTITTSTGTNTGWFYGMTQFFEQLQEIDVVKDYRLTIDERVIDCTFSKRPSEYDDYECGNSAPISGNDTGEDYYLMIRTGKALYLYIKEETAKQHTIKLEVASQKNSLSYADMIYEHFDVDKTVYPYLFYYHYNNSGRGTLDVYFAKTFELNSSGIIRAQDSLQADQSSIYPPVIETTESVACGVVALVGLEKLKTNTSVVSVQSFDKSGVTTYTNVDVDETTRYANIVKI